MAGWTVFLGWTLAILLLVRGLRWLRDHVMWSVRNRLIVTYLFIGGVPVTLAVAIGLLSGYLVLGDLAVFSAVSEIKAEANRLGAANAAAEEEITRHSSTPEKIAAADTEFPGRSIAVLPMSSLPVGADCAGSAAELKAAMHDPMAHAKHPRAGEPARQPAGEHIEGAPRVAHGVPQTVIGHHGAGLILRRQAGRRADALDLAAHRQPPAV
jgi:hypothetical protein